MITYEPGRYTVRVTDQQLAKSEGKGTPCLVFTIQPVLHHTPSGDRNADDNGPRRIALYFATAENAAISIEQLRALGWNGTSFHDLAGDGEVGWSLVGDELSALCKQETYQRDGEQRTGEKWSFLTGTGGLKTAPAVKQDVLDLQARFGHLLAANPPRQPSPNGKPKPSPVPANANEVPDEVPF